MVTWQKNPFYDHPSGIEAEQQLQKQALQDKLAKYQISDELKKFYDHPTSQPDYKAPPPHLQEPGIAYALASGSANENSDGKGGTAKGKEQSKGWNDFLENLGNAYTYQAEIEKNFANNVADFLGKVGSELGKIGKGTLKSWDKTTDKMLEDALTGKGTKKTISAYGLLALMSNPALLGLTLVAQLANLNNKPKSKPESESDFEPNSPEADAEEHGDWGEMGD